jgi:hypothetical protein
MFFLSQALEEYVQYYYGHLFSNNSGYETVSVHLRLGYNHEPSKPLLARRGLPPESYYERALESFDRTKVRFLIFADDLQQAYNMMGSWERFGFNLLFIDENVIVSVRLMSLCTHHIMTSSTLSFWGAYLDPRQPTGGRTLLHEVFFKSHGHNMIPYPEWEVFRDS